MTATWVCEELQDVDLGDSRLDERMAKVLTQLGARPTASIPAACGGAAETAGAYRFFDNPKVSLPEVLEPHFAATRKRLAAQPVAILVQDTTELDLTRPKQQVVGAGHLDGGSRRGAFLHPLMAFTPDGTPLGSLQAELWTRDQPPTPATAAEKRAALREQPIEDKESYRWIATLQQAREEARRAPQTQCVCVADSEADIYELLTEASREPGVLDWIVRSCQDRALSPAPLADGAESPPAARRLREGLLQAPVLFQNRITIRGRTPKVGCDARGRRQPRTTRQAEVEVRAAVLTLQPPKRPDRKLPPLTVHAVLVREVNPPADEPPVEWLLLTSLPIAAPDDVRRVIEYYTARWLIEVYFRTLKSACRVESRLFERMDRFEPCLGVYLIVTWRTLFVCRLGREFPELNCEAVFEPSEWKAVYAVVHRRPPPAEPPPLREMVRLVARLGGYVEGPKRGEPGPQTLWLGMQRLHDLSCCWDVFGPESHFAGGDV